MHIGKHETGKAKDLSAPVRILVSSLFSNIPTPCSSLNVKGRAIAVIGLGDP
jgi:hypothetical protein